MYPYRTLTQYLNLMTIFLKRILTDFNLSIILTVNSYLLLTGWVFSRDYTQNQWYKAACARLIHGTADLNKLGGGKTNEKVDTILPG